MNKKHNVRVWALIMIMVVMSIFAAGCQKSENSNAETTIAAETAEITVPVTTGPGIAFNELGEPEFYNDEQAEVYVETTEKLEETTALENQTQTEKSTEPVEPNVTEPETKSTEQTIIIEESEQEVTEALSEYEKYLMMSGNEQTAFIESFDSPADFFEWLNNAKEEHQSSNPDIPVGDGIIDLSEVN